jgi:hypothetical protein
MATINELLTTMGINPADLEKTASAAPASNSNPIAEFLTKVAEDMGQMGEEDQIQMIIQALQDLKQRKMSGEQLSPEEEQFIQEAEPMLAQMGKSAAVKQAAGQSDITAQYQEQQGLMAEAFRTTGSAQKITNIPRGTKGDERGGEDNPAANGMRSAYDNGPASKTTEGSNNPTLTGETKSAMAKVAEQAIYNKTVDSLSDYVIEKLAGDQRFAGLFQQEKTAQYHEKIAEVQKLAAAAELEGRIMARAFVDELNKFAAANGR